MSFTPAPSASLPGGRWRVRGAGPVALAFIAFAVRAGVWPASICLDPPLPDARPLPDALAARAIAISEGTAQLLARIMTLPAGGIIERVDVSMRGHLGRTRIEASDLGMPALGRVVRYGALVQALRDAVTDLPLAAATGASSDALTVHAEGDPGEDAARRTFGQSALLGEVWAPQAQPEHRHTAYERFTPAGPLALLPLPESGRWTLVWCDTPDVCDARLRTSFDRLSHDLQQRFGDRLGPLQVRGPLSVSALERRARRATVVGSEVWIGNAAQALHPVAGQGMNLGMRDAFELARLLAQAHRRQADLREALLRWQQSRRVDRTTTLVLTDTMATSFTWPLVRPLQSPALAMLDLIPALRRPLASQLMFGLR